MSQNNHKNMSSRDMRFRSYEIWLRLSVFCVLLLAAISTWILWGDRDKLQSTDQGTATSAALNLLYDNIGFIPLLAFLLYFAILAFVLSGKFDEEEKLKIMAKSDAIDTYTSENIKAFGKDHYKIAARYSTFSVLIMFVAVAPLTAFVYYIIGERINVSNRGGDNELSADVIAIGGVAVAFSAMCFLFSLLYWYVSAHHRSVGREFYLRSLDIATFSGTKHAIDEFKVDGDRLTLMTIVLKRLFRSTFHEKFHDKYIRDDREHEMEDESNRGGRPLNQQKEAGQSSDEEKDKP